MKRMLSLITTAVVLLTPLATVVPAQAQATNAYVASEEYFEAPDGTQLYAQVFRPVEADPATKTPVIMVITPYQYFIVPETGPTLLYAELQDQMRVFEKGYTVVQASLRGYGKSEGCGDFGGPGEQMDALTAVKWAASQPWSTGKVGTYGISYDAWTQMMAYAHDAPLSAAVVSSPLISPYRGLYMNRVHYAEGWHATPGIYGVLDLTSPGTPTADSPTCYPENALETAGSDPSAPYWKERDLIAAAGESRIPTFWTHGFLDRQTKPDNFLDVYSKLDGFRRAWFGQFVHRIPDEETGNKRFYAEAGRFFDRFLLGKKAPADPPVEIQEGSEGTWRTEQSWPPVDSRLSRLPLKGGTYSDSYEDDAGPATERGTWSFSQPLPYDVHMAGVPKIDVRVDALVTDVHVHARLFDVSGTNAELISRGVATVEGQATPGGVTDHRVRFDLYPQDWVVAKGHRIGVLLSGADNEWFDPGATSTTVRVEGDFLLPFLRLERDRFIPNTGRSRDMAESSSLALTKGFIEERTIKMPLPPKMR